MLLAFKERWMERVYWITHKEKKILVTNYEGLHTTEELRLVVDREVEIELASQSKILVLSRVANTTITTEFMRYAQQKGRDVRSIKVEKTAVLGITGVKVILLKSYILFSGEKTTLSFNTERAALDWLVS